jgi:RHS repeat-associated protein
LTICYNVLNLPDTIQFTAGHQNYYTYDASGKKLEVQNITSRNILNLPQDTITRLVSSTKLTTDYCGDAIYQNDTLKEVLTPEGYWQNGLYYYYLKDHQGSTREVLRQDNTVMEYSDYYPDGMRFWTSTSNSAALPYRYNGKELEAMNGLNEYDYGTRRRETGIPVWTTMDPLSEKYYGVSPYVYCTGNPVNTIDLDGRDATIIIKDGKVIVQANIILYSQEGSIDKSTVEKFQKQINNAWSKDKNGEAWTYTKDGKSYEVSFDIKVIAGNSNLSDKENRNYNGENNYIKIVDGNDYSYKSNVAGNYHDGVWAKDTKEAYHEFGHLLGLQDRYLKDANGNAVLNKNGEAMPESTSYKGNVMAQYGGIVEQKNINAFLSIPFNQYNSLKIIYGRMPPSWTFAKTKEFREEK